MQIKHVQKDTFVIQVVLVHHVIITIQLQFIKLKIVLFVPIFVAALLPIEDWQRLVLIFSGFIPGVIGLCFAMKIEQVAGYYKCKVCGHCYVPTYKAVNIAMHFGRTRYMKCPECHKRSWQKKVVSKD